MGRVVAQQQPSSSYPTLGSLASTAADSTYLTTVARRASCPWQEWYCYLPTRL